MSKSAKVMSKIVEINGIKTELTHYSSKETDHCLIFFPGNPGLASFYVEFLSKIHDELNGDLDIICCSYPGHSPADGSMLNLDEQIQHKIDLVDYLSESLSDTKFYIGGHSIGAHMAINVIKHRPNHNIVKVFALFPTLHGMAETPRGKEVSKITGAVARSVIAWVVVVLNILPMALLVKICQLVTKQPKPMAQVTVQQLCRYNTIKSVLHLADWEMKQVIELDKDTINKHCDKLVMYYSQDDGWVPMDYYHEIKAEFPDVEIHLCKDGMDHAFVTHHSVAMGVKMAGWIRNLIK
ncbi:hypothetical protein HK103_002785 [Boothiomyces macroporosus]|uniref:Lipid droplet-associated hydrolase n=1 Tax=Boothiomyces macroporosus TaxID=261099 RepID=A0AAD5UQ87_9FUNG|nr:hypothetical protein HK103_002758 [Boothiomyces macroporosus]KAJ3262370.1 hypothetical protein HK103_002785 [Boothiomyces macroporosus]